MLLQSTTTTTTSLPQPHNYPSQRTNQTRQVVAPHKTLKNLIKPALKAWNSESKIQTINNNNNKQNKGVKFNEQCLEQIRCFTIDSCPKFINGQRPLDIETVNFKPKISSISNTTSIVSLETITLDQKEESIKGSILVQNLAFHKRVQIRITFDNWDSFETINAKYKEPIKTTKSNIDRFIFNIKLEPKISRAKVPETCHKLQFAINYTVNNTEYWDNNFNKNYKLDILPSINLDPTLVGNEKLLSNAPIKSAASASNNTKLLNNKQKPFSSRYEFNNDDNSTGNFGKGFNFENFKSNAIPIHQNNNYINIQQQNQQRYNPSCITNYGTSPPSFHIGAYHHSPNNNYSSFQNYKTSGSWFDNIPNPTEYHHQGFYGSSSSPTYYGSPSMISSG